MFETINNPDEERGQVGIGTLIVFIALVLVAAIAAGVLINTAGFLQNQAESTGEESTQQVTQSLNAQSSIGTVDSSVDSVSKIEVTVSKAPGAGPINVSESSIQYVSPDGADTLTLTGSNNEGDATFSVSGSEPLEDDSDTATIAIALAESGANSTAMDNLEPGEEAELRITTASGGQSTVVVNVPKPLGADQGDQIRL